MAVLVNPETGQAFEVGDNEADDAIQSMGLSRATPDQVSYLERQKADYESRLGRSAAALPTTETGGRAVGAPPQVSLADVQRMFRSGDWGTFKGREAEIMAAYQSGQLK